ncbi:MAG: hypothetical protein IJR93_14035 [Treponema sp.]|nr:hypothetical protein [Treponema sp.]
MKKNKILYGFTAALLALSLFGFAACSSGNDDDDEDDIHSTLEGKTFVAGDCTLKIMEYDSGSAVTNTYSVSKMTYIVGESDDLVTFYGWSSPSSTKYSSVFIKYSISGDTITFTTNDGESYTATINGDNSFTLTSKCLDDGGDSSYDITDDNLTFTQGDKPEKATFTKK